MDKKEKSSRFLTNAIKNKLKLCLFSMINDATLDEDENLSPDLVELKKEVFDCFSKFPDLLKSSDTERGPVLEKLTELGRKVLEAGVPVFALINYNLAAEGLISHEHIWRGEVKYTAKGLSPNEIVENIRDFAYGVLDEDKEDSFKKTLISRIPCIMSRGKFADYVKAAVKYGDGNELCFENKFTNLPFSVSEGREAYPEMYEELDKILRTSLNKISDDELYDLANHIPMNSTDIFGLSDCIAMLHSDINYMLALLYYCIDIEFITEDDMILKDIFYSAAELCGKDSLDEIDIELRRQTNDRSEDVLSDLFEGSEEIKKESADIDKIYYSREAEDKSIQKMLEVYSKIKAFYYSEAELSVRKFYARKSEEALKSGESAAEGFISDFENETAAFAPAVKKGLRRQVISELPCPYSVDETLNYVKSVLEQYYDKPGYDSIYEQLNIAVNIHDNKFVKRMLNNLKMPADLKDDCGCEDHHHHHHHHHDDDCDCGCDHHHAHNFEKHL